MESRNEATGGRDGRPAGGITRRHALALMGAGVGAGLVLPQFGQSTAEADDGPPSTNEFGLAMPYAPQEPSVPDRSVSVAEFGAIPNDGSDDSSAIQLAIDTLAAKGGGTVWFEAGTYDLSVRRADGYVYTPITLRSRIRLAARRRGAAVLRMADRQGDYYTMIGTFPRHTGTRFPRYANEPLSDVVLDGLTIDMNGPGTPIHETGHPFGAVAYQRNAVWAMNASRIVIENCHFTNGHSTTVLLVQGDGTDGRISHCVFDKLGGASRDYDSATINAQLPRFMIDHCSFSSRFGIGNNGTHSAIEVHGNDKTVVHNKVEHYHHGMNVTGTQFPESRRQLIAHNTMSGTELGIRLWHRHGNHGTEGGLQDTTVIHNQIFLEPSGWYKMFIGGPTAGIFASGAGDAPIDGCALAYNRILSRGLDVMAQDREYFSDSESAGISLWKLATREPWVMRNFTIKHNVIRNTLSAGVWSNTTLENGLITRNVVMNPGLNGTFDPPKEVYDTPPAKPYIPYRDDFRVPFYLGGDNTNVTVDGNRCAGRTCRT